MVGKREHGIHLVSVNRPGIDRPAADHGHALARDLLEDARPLRARRTDQHLAGNVIRVVARVWAERLAELLVNAGHGEDGVVQHGREAGAIQGAENFLGLA